MTISAMRHRSGYVSLTSARHRQRKRQVGRQSSSTTSVAHLVGLNADGDAKRLLTQTVVVLDVEGGMISADGLGGGLRDSGFRLPNAQGSSRLWSNVLTGRDMRRIQTTGVCLPKTSGGGVVSCPDLLRLQFSVLRKPRRRLTIA